MSREEEGSKTEQATPKRREDAFQEGNFPKTPDLGVVFVLAAACFMIAFSAKRTAAQVGIFSRHLFETIGQVELNQDTAMNYLSQRFMEMLSLIFPILGICFIAAIIAGGLQSGFRLTPKALELKFDKLNPVTGFKNLFSSRSLIRGMGDILKFSAVGLVIYGAMREVAQDAVFGSPVPISYIGNFIHSTFCIMLIRLTVALGVIALLNYMYQRYRITKDLRMTKQEVKDERKQQEGDPHMKMVMRSMARRLLQQQMLKDVPYADVVVTNPTHYAVALKYETGKDLAPIVLAKGESMFAQRIKEIAKEHKVPIVENKPVARILYRIGKVGEAIPSNLYQVVAEILSQVYRTHKYYFNRLKTRRMSRQPEV